MQFFLGKSRADYPDWLIRWHYWDDFEFERQRDELRTELDSLRRPGRPNLISSEVFSMHGGGAAAQARRIRAMHPSDVSVSIDKLARFLSGWTGGPKLYSERYGPIRIPIAHRHLAVDEPERDAWLLCMKKALELQDYPQEFKDFLLQRLSIPAERCRNRP